MRNWFKQEAAETIDDAGGACLARSSAMVPTGTVCGGYSNNDCEGAEAAGFAINCGGGKNYQLDGRRAVYGGRTTEELGAGGG